MSFYGDPYGFGGGYGPPSYYPAYPAQYYSSGNTVYHHRRKPPKEKDNAQVWCDVCDVGCIGQQSYIEHCAGRKHQLLERKRAQQAAPQGIPGPTDVEQVTEKPTNTTTTTTGQSSSSNVRFTPYDASPSQGAKGQQGKFYCELCKIYSNDQSTFQLHLAGKKHKINMQRMQPTVTDQYGPPIAALPPSSVIHPPRYHIPSSPRSHFTPTLANTPTNVEDDLLLNSKLESLTPSTSDTLSLRQLVEQVTAKLDESSEKNTMPQTTGPPIVVMEIKLVGPYAWGTLLKVNLVADIAVITKEHPTFGTLRYMQQVLSEAIPEAQIEIGKDTLDMHILMPQGYSVHLLFTWVGSWESSDRSEAPDLNISPLSSPSSPSSPSPLPAHPSSSSTPYPDPPVVSSTSSVPVRHWTATSLLSSPFAPPLASSTTTTTTTTSSSPVPTSAPPQAVTPISPADSSSNPSAPFGHEPPMSLSHSPISTGHDPNINVSHVPYLPLPPHTHPIFYPPLESRAQATSSSSTTTTTITSSMQLDSSQDINLLASQRALLMIRQAMWFSHNSLSPNVRQCIKIMKDLRHRHAAFAAINNWALEVMVVNALRTLPLSASISQSLRAIFAFIASGTLLPGVDLLDPCVQYGSVLQHLSQEDRLAITKAAQKILNDIAFGRWEVIVG